MIGGKVTEETRRAVSVKIVARLREMTEEEQRAFLVRLLDFLDPTFVVALNFAYEVTPNERSKE